MKVKEIILIQLTLFLLITCGKNINNSADEARKVKAVASYTREIPDEVPGFGSLSYLTKVDITSPQEAVIKKLFFREGDNVMQGQIVVQLDNPQIKLAVERAENNFSLALASRNLAESRLLEGIFNAEAQLLALEKADMELSLSKRRWEEDRRKHQNQEILFEAGGIHTEAILVSRFSLDTEWEQILLMERELEIRKIGFREQDLIKAGLFVPLGENEKRNAFIALTTSGLKSELKASEARLEAASKELSSANIALNELTIRSPVSGILGARFLEEGERVRSQDKIFSLIDTASLYAIFPVREKDAVRIEKGMTASVLIDGTGEIRDGIVDLIYPQADSQSLSFLIRVLLTDSGFKEENKLKPGMFARVTVNAGYPRTAVYIPESSIFNLKSNEGNVFIINGSVLTERKVILGSVYGEEREVLNGIKKGEIIVSRPEPDLKEGSYVAVTE